MIILIDSYTRLSHHVAAKAVMKVSDARPPSVARSIVTLFDGTMIECEAAASVIAKKVEEEIAHE